MPPTPPLNRRMMGLSEVRTAQERAAMGTVLLGSYEPRPLAGRCGARTRRGTACQCKGDGRGGRCKFHGGKSTGPRTEAGRARISAVQKARWEQWRATKNDRLLTRLYGLLGIAQPMDGIADEPSPGEPTATPESASSQRDGGSSGQQASTGMVPTQPRHPPVSQSSKVPNRYARAHLRRG